MYKNGLPPIVSSNLDTVALAREFEKSSQIFGGQNAVGARNGGHGSGRGSVGL